MKVSQAMTRDVRLASPDQSICDVAKIMAECDVGALPVSENDRLIGMITDRDIAIRAVAKQMAPDTKVRQVMSSEVKYCYEDEEISHVAENIGEVQLHRLPVVDRQKHLVGIIALADIAKSEGQEYAGKAICGISGGKSSSTGSSSSMHH
jgi:IMP dehydrogenase